MRPSLKGFAFSLLAGIVGSYALPPYGLWPLMFLSLSAFYVLYARTETPRRAAATGFFYALGYFTAGLWWIGNALLVEGNEFWWVWPLAVIGLPVLLSFFTAVYTGMAFCLSSGKTLPGFFAWVGAIALSEWVRGHIFTGFPWNLFGYVWAGTLPLAQMAALLGAYGLTLLTLMWAATPGFLWAYTSSLTRKSYMAAGMAVTLLAALTYGHVRLKQNPTAFNDAVHVRIVQPNIGQDLKWDAGRAVQHFEKHLRLSQPQKPADRTTVLVWPETAIPSVFLRTPAARENIQRLLASFGAPAFLISGILDRRIAEDGPLYYNGIAVFDARGGMTPVYSKTHLVPFGEYIPFQKYIPIKPVVAFSGFEKGPGTLTVTQDGIPAFSPLVCYEIIFPGKATARRPIDPMWIVNVTNDAWYGDSAGPHQHFAHSIFRAIEEGVPVVRSANTGISGMTDSYGRVIAKSKIGTEDVLNFPLPIPASSPPVFARTGDFFFLILAMCSMLICLFYRKKS